MSCAKLNSETLPLSESKEIKPINNETIHKICSGQVVLSLAIAMKELVENSVDAAATIIDIHLKEYGSELVEVSDNGCGVNKENFQALTLKHCTSKINEFNDLERLTSLGFRGEALSSLCALSEVEICTKHNSAEVATRLKYDQNGCIVSQEITARQQGTTVSLKNLFCTLPVRRKQFERNLKKEFSKMCNLLYAYCLLPSGIKYNCTNTTKGSTNTIVATGGNKTIRENIISVFGVKQLASLVEVEIVEPNEQILEEFSLNEKLNPLLLFEFKFMISTVTHGNGRSSTDRQFFYINNRPCEPTKVIKLVNEIYRQFNNKQYPFVYLNIITKSCIVDVNITPDKRQVFFEQEKLLLATIKVSLLECFKEFPSTLKVQNFDVTKSLKEREEDNAKKGIKRFYSEVSNNISKVSIIDQFQKKSKSDDVSISRKRKSSFIQSCSSSGNNSDYSGKSFLDGFSAQDLECSQKEADQDLQQLVDIAFKLSQKNEEPEDKVIITDSPLLEEEKKSSRREIKLNWNFDLIKKHFDTQLVKTEPEIACSSFSVKFRSEIKPESNKLAEDEFNKNIKKSDFSNMDIIGQFNLGFIIVKLKNDLFIIDQHATDEKYNFECLQQNMVLKTQKLITPKLLELTASARSTLIEHEAIFNKNGFIFNTIIDDDSEEKIFLTSIPMSDRTIFGKADIDEMIFMLQEDSSQDKFCRPSRIRSMLASRACRKSIMIGKHLSEGEMKKLIQHMGDIEQPWNCPHGRPTMRHLVNLKLLSDKI